MWVSLAVCVCFAASNVLEKKPKHTYVVISTSLEAAVRAAWGQWQHAQHAAAQQCSAAYLDGS
jgi:hypothetical protein